MKPQYPGSVPRLLGLWSLFLLAFFALTVTRVDAASPRVVITPAPGFSILWDGNNGGFSSPDAGAGPADNVALASNGTVPFSSSDLGPVLMISYHVVENLNDGLYGNAHSWISANGVGGTTDSDPFAGLTFPSSVNISSIAWGRDNGDGVERAEPFGDRAVGVYTLQHTTVAAPNAATLDTGDAATGWATIGTVEYTAGADNSTFASYLRHRFDVAAGGSAIPATGLRIKVSSGQIDLDEIEVNPPADPTPPISNLIVITSAAGYAVDWDGNDGKLNDPGAPAVAPPNRASVANGTTPFTSSDLGPLLSIPFHRAVNLNDSLYGNAHSWISANGVGGSTDPNPFAGLSFGGLVELKRIAWGRDNGDTAEGTFDDRALGIYTLQITRVPNPGVATAETGDPTTGWQTVSTFEYKSLGPQFTPHLRHRYGLALTTGGGIPATGLRLKVSNGSIAIDEIEVNPFVAPEQDLGDAIVLTPQGTYSVTWDGNDGEFNNLATGARTPAHDGLASQGAIAFGSSELVWGGSHLIANVNDGLYGNSHSWISIGGVPPGSDPDPYIGIALGRQVNISTLAWGRDNGDATEAGCGGSCADRSIAIYTIQITRVAAPGIDTLDTGDAATGWETVGTVEYRRPVAPAFTPNLRHSFALANAGQPIQATGVRLKVSDDDVAIDEIEVNPTTTVTAPPVSDLLVITPASNYGINWDGNDGEFANPAAGASAPINAGLATRGATAFASSQLDFGVHFTANLNDGLYGNAHSWIADFSAVPDPNPFCGIALPGIMAVRNVAWGRDNGDTTETGCAGGTCPDRSLGTYTLQITRVANPGVATPETGDAGTGWETVGTFQYKAGFANLFTPHLRHRFNVSQNNAPVAASGIRLKVSSNQIAIDELEVNPYVKIDENSVVVQPETGFAIEWDGNNGDYFTTSTPAPVPDNDALASHGATPFGSTEFGGGGVHLISHINDGLYGNSHSWIADFAGGDGAPAIGVAFGKSIAVQTIAWGRDNGGDPPGDSCACADRTAGNYLLQFTEVAAPDNSTVETGDPATGWMNIGRLEYRGGGSALFRHHLRHEYQVSQNGAPFNATGIRIAVSNPNICIDELEVNTRPPLPSPSLRTTRDAGDLLISWSGGGQLESAAQITGPWTAVPNATSPYRKAITGAQNYYRVVR